MKKLITILTLFAFTLYANKAPPVENPDTESPPIYSAPNPPIRERTDEPPSNTWKIVTAVVGTVATITLGLFASGRNTGKHIKPTAERTKAAERAKAP